MCVVAPRVLFSVYFFDKTDDMLLSLSQNLVGVSQYTQGTWELKSIVVLSNAQPFERGPPIHNRVREVPFDIPHGYVKFHYIY